MRPPVGTIVLLSLVVLLSAATIGSFSGYEGSDAAGRGMAQAFGALFAMALWVVLAILLVVAAIQGRPPVWAMIVAVALLALSAYGATQVSAREPWPLGLLPLLLALYAVWMRFPLLRKPYLGIGLAAAVAAVALVPIVFAIQAARPDPEREARLAAERQAAQEADERRLKEQHEADAARFAKLGPDSSLEDYLEYAKMGERRAEARKAMRLVKSRQADAVALLKAGRMGDLSDLLELDVDATPELCKAFGAALAAAAARVDKRVRSDYLSAAIILEWQLPNMQWLTTERCDLGESLALLERNVRAAADSSRMTKFADTLAKLRAAK